MQSQIRRSVDQLVQRGVRRLVQQGDQADLKPNEAGDRPKVSPPQKLVEERDF